MTLSKHLKVVAIAALSAGLLTAPTMASTINPVQINPVTSSSVYGLFDVKAPGSAGWHFHVAKDDSTVAINGIASPDGQLAFASATLSSGGSTIATTTPFTTTGGSFSAVWGNLMSSVDYLLTVGYSYSGDGSKATSFSGNVSVVPLPPALLLFGSGIAGLGLLARRKKATSQNNALATA